MTAAGEAVPAGRPEADLHIAVLDGHKEAFFEADHAQALIEQWNGAHADTIARDRAEGYPEAAGRLTGRVETCEQAYWRRYGPGGMAAVWTRVPESRPQHARMARFIGITRRRELEDSGPYLRNTWEFQSWFTTLPVRRRIEVRPRGVVEVAAYGLDQEVVEAAFEEAATHVTASPNSDDHLDPVGVLKVLRGLAEEDSRRHAYSESAFHVDVRAALSCGLVDEEQGPGLRLRLTGDGLAFAERHALASLPDPRLAVWDDSPSLAEAVAELHTRYPAVAAPS